LKDLRSQITREACITISYLATLLGSGFTHFAEVVVPQLIVLLSNTAKVMASSAEVCVKLIIKVTTLLYLSQWRPLPVDDISCYTEHTLSPFTKSHIIWNVIKIIRHKKVSCII
jgi:hypothetical protein